MEQMKQIRDKCQEVFAKATSYWPHLDFSKVGIRFDLKGRCAGMAHYDRAGNHYMRFNADMLKREAFEHLLNDTVPHEIAHIVCFMDRKLGRNHDSGWCNVCLKLGGTGQRCHTEEVVYGKGYTYEYISSNGSTIRVGDKYHCDIQSGSTLPFRKGKGSLHKGCAYSVVGFQGRSYENPIVKKAEADATPFERITIVGADTPLLKQMFPEVKPLVIKPVPRVEITAAHPGESKAAISRRLMSAGYRDGKSYEAIIAEMIAANGYDRQLARGTFKANAPKIGIPENFYK